MLKIARVGFLDESTLDVQFSNGNILLLELDPFLQKPGFTELLEDDRILYPKTDGTTVFWRDGPRLTVDEILDMLCAV